MHERWHRFDIRQLEDFTNAVFGAELEVIQMAGPRVRGSLAFAARNGITFSSGLIQGSVAVSGPLSHDAITIGVALRVGQGSTQWLNTIRSGDVGVFLPGDEQDGLFTKGSLYFAATLTEKRLEEEAAREGLKLEPGMVSRTGLHFKSISTRTVAQLYRSVAPIHSNRVNYDERRAEAGFAMMRIVLEHYARLPLVGDGRVDPLGRASIVDKARRYIRANLTHPVSMETLAAASGTSQRSLARAFVEVLHDTPANYVRRLRLHRIRKELATEAQRGCRVSEIAEKWGIAEPGRMSGWYRELFGELPSETRARGQLQNQIKKQLL